jgi:hypothetical protein
MQIKLDRNKMIKLINQHERDVTAAQNQLHQKQQAKQTETLNNSQYYANCDDFRTNLEKLKELEPKRIFVRNLSVV